jgi:hypothetical protein
MVGQRNTMTFIQKIFEKNIDEEIHKSFTRFSRGTFEGRGVTKIKVSKEKIRLWASYDLVNDIMEMSLPYIKEAKVTGRVIKEKKKIDINETMTGEQLKNLCKEYDFVLLNIQSDNITFKSKTSLPKPGKPLSEKFSSGTFPLELLKEFVFDHELNFKQAFITHTVEVNNIIIPEEVKNDPVQARLQAKRQGTLTRILTIDGKETTAETTFTI